MPRKSVPPMSFDRSTLSTTQEPLEAVFADLRVLLEARRAEYQAAADRIRDILTSMQPKPRIGRPPAKRA